MNYLLHGWKSMFKYSGRATLSQYWMFQFINVSLAFLYFILTFGGEIAFSHSHETPMLIAVFAMRLLDYAFFALIGLYLPAIVSLTIRRLHDAGLTGWWIVLGLMPFGNLLLLFLCTLDSDPNNKWGAPSLLTTEKGV